MGTDSKIEIDVIALFRRLESACIQERHGRLIRHGESDVFKRFMNGV